MPVNARNTGRVEKSSSKAAIPGKTSATDGLASMNNAQTEEERIAAMFEVQNEQWERQQQEMAKYANHYCHVVMFSSILLLCPRGVSMQPKGCFCRVVRC